MTTLIGIFSDSIIESDFTNPTSELDNTEISSYLAKSIDALSTKASINELGQFTYSSIPSALDENSVRRSSISSSVRTFHDPLTSPKLRNSIASSIGNSLIPQSILPKSNFLFAEPKRSVEARQLTRQPKKEQKPFIHKPAYRQRESLNTALFNALRIKSNMYLDLANASRAIKRERQTQYQMRQGASENTLN
eukprot:CAMPEP_0117432220 /NCGR_PEP_ID=MMETSP0758-20121206/11741_1 /TAXON_ID=63605 /ORGANISM="Percolomonas cosmopolitus, Strain AE-1 (ATCC 50343)" /LENGTH=192 /DNA_ID=CAMNT_0005221985 /DNA_START=198 /DNA_END=773 /DNA_ORIENTATION=+